MAILGKVLSHKPKLVTNFNKAKLIVVWSLLGYVAGNVYPSFTVTPLYANSLPDTNSFVMSDDSLPTLNTEEDIND